MAAQHEIQCLHHHSDFTFCCKDCRGELVCLECITTTHQSHTLEKISKVGTRKKMAVQDYIKRTEKTELPLIKSKIDAIDKQIIDDSKHIKTITDRIHLQGERLKAEIDKIVKHLLQKCTAVEQSNKESLSIYKQRLQSMYSQLQQRVESCKESLTSGSTIRVIRMEMDTHKNLSSSPVPDLQVMDFTEGQCPFTHLIHGIGSLSFQRKEGMAKSQSLKKNRTYNLPDVSEIKLSTPVSSIVKSRLDGCVWVSWYKDNRVLLLNMQGVVIESVKLESNVYDMSLSPVTKNLWLCCDDCSVYEIIEKTPVLKFRDAATPLSLCVTPDGSVLIGAYNSLTLYDTEGQVLRSLSESQKHLLALPHRTEVCPRTNDIAVLEWDKNSVLGGKDKPHVSVFTSKLVLKYMYYGPPTSEHKRIIKSNFYPWDAAYDTVGHLLIADYSNMCVHLVGDGGRFLASIQTGKLQPVALALIQDGHLCIGSEAKLMKVIHYKV